MPMAAPAISPSASGVSCTRVLPKRCCRPTVARNTPPFAPTSSPSTITDGSHSISQACARLTASTIVSFAIYTGPGVDSVTGRRIAARFFALCLQPVRQLRIQVVEHGVGRLLRGGKVLTHRRVDLLAAAVPQCLLRLLIPQLTR